MNEVLPYVLGASVCLALSLIFSAYEAAYFALTAGEQQKLRNRQHRWVRRFYNEPPRFLGVLTIADLLVNILFVFYCIRLSSYLFAGEPFLLVGSVAGVLLLPALLIIGEYYPRLVGAAQPKGVLVSITFLMVPIYYLLYLPGQLLGQLAQYAYRPMGVAGQRVTNQGLKQAILNTPESESPKEEKKVLSALVDLGDIMVRGIMRSRVDIKALENTATREEVIEAISQFSHSRIPVYKESLDNIIGILYIKDLLRNLNNPSLHWQRLLHQPYYVAETKRLNTLLRAFQEQRQHMAVVVDEYGGISGIITLEDVLEEIFGDIRDESDTDDPNWHRLADNAFVIDGRMPLLDVCRITELPEEAFDELKGDNDSLAGLLLEQHGGLPKVGVLIEAGRFEFQVLAATDTHVERVKLVINDESDTDQPE